MWVFRVQDTPGYGDDQDISKHIELIVGHIDAQNQKWLELENAKDRCGQGGGVGSERCLWVKAAKARLGVHAERMLGLCCSS